MKSTPSTPEYSLLSVEEYRRTFIEASVLDLRPLLKADLSSSMVICPEEVVPDLIIKKVESYG